MRESIPRHTSASNSSSIVCTAPCTVTSYEVAPNQCVLHATWGLQHGMPHLRQQHLPAAQGTAPAHIAGDARVACVAPLALQQSCSAWRLGSRKTRIIMQGFLRILAGPLTNGWEAFSVGHPDP